MSREAHHGVSEQSKASHHRRDDAQVLLNAARWRGAMYLGGYSIECLIKSKLMQKFGCKTLRGLDEDLKDRGLISAEATMYTHQFESLLRVSGHLDRLRSDAKLWPSFTLVNRWVPAWRYDPDLSSREEAEDFFEALDRITSWIRANV
jgi:HEPN domain-containing protein